MLKRLDLQNFRSCEKREFEFSDGVTLIVGPNAVGKTNILEAIYTLATGKSFRAEAEQELVRVGEQVSRVACKTNNTELEIDWDARERFTKIYKVNGVGKRMVDFVGNLRVVLFCPQDIEIVADSPSTRRKYLDSVLNLVHKDYRVAGHIFERALRQRNRLLWRIREQNLEFTMYNKQLDYWDELLIVNGRIIHERRKEYLEFLGFDYDHSIVSAERLKRYAVEEVAAATTLVGPQRDNFKVKIQKAKGKMTSQNSKVFDEYDAKAFGSRGEQRLAVFAMKLKELEYVEKVTGEKPTLLLDDIFSELDHTNRHKILEVIPKQQTIMTTTDLHFIDRKALKEVQLVELD